MTARADDVICEATGKKKFSTPEQADRRRKVLKSRRNERLTTFRCRACRKWHLGHPR